MLQFILNLNEVMSGYTTFMAQSHHCCMGIYCFMASFLNIKMQDLYIYSENLLIAMSNQK